MMTRRVSSASNSGRPASSPASIVSSTSSDSHRRKSGGRTIFTNYSLNQAKSLQKKRDACDRDSYSITKRDFCATIIFNTVAFEEFRKSLAQFYQGNEKYQTTLNVMKDNAEFTAQDTIKVHDRTKRNTPHIYTINVYRTTSTVMVNGPHHLTFVNNDLPVITEVIDKMNNSIRMISSRVKQTLSSSISICQTKTNERNTVAPEKELRLRKCMTSEPSESELTPLQSGDEKDSEIQIVPSASEDDSDQFLSDEESDLVVPSVPSQTTKCTTTQSEETSSEETSVDDIVPSQTTKSTTAQTEETSSEETSVNNPVQADIDCDTDNLVQCVCNQIDTEKMMECGDCKKWTHYECTQLPLYMLKQLCNNKLRKYQCRTCISTSEDDARLFNVDLSECLVDGPRKITINRSSQTPSDVVDKLTAKMNCVEQENVSLNIRLQTSLDELKKLQVTNNLQKNVISTKDEEISTLKSNLAQTQRDLTNKMKGHELAATQLDRLKKETRKLENKVATLQKENEESATQKLDLQKQIDAHLELRGMMNNIEDSDLDSTKATLQRSVEQLQNENINLQAQIDILKSSESEKLKKNTKEISSLKHSNLVMSETVKDYTKQVQDLTQKLQISEACKDREVVMNNVLSQRVQQAEATLADKEKIIQARKTESEQKDRQLGEDVVDQEQYEVIDEIYDTSFEQENDHPASSPKSRNSSNNNRSIHQDKNTARRTPLANNSAKPPPTEILNDICETEFLDGPGRCTKTRCKKSHKIDFRKARRGVCFREFNSAGSCTRKHRCRFSHDIPGNLRNDPWMCAQVDEAKIYAEKKRSSRMIPNLHGKSVGVRNIPNINAEDKSDNQSNSNQTPAMPHHILPPKSPKNFARTCDTVDQAGEQIAPPSLQKTDSSSYHHLDNNNRQRDMPHHSRPILSPRNLTRSFDAVEQAGVQVAPSSLPKADSSTNHRLEISQQRKVPHQYHPASSPRNLASSLDAVDRVDRAGDKRALPSLLISDDSSSNRHQGNSQQRNMSDSPNPVTQASNATIPLDQQSFLHLIRSMIQEQIPQWLMCQQQSQPQLQQPYLQLQPQQPYLQQTYYQQQW